MSDLLSPSARTDLEEMYDYTRRRDGIAQAEDSGHAVRYAIERAAVAPHVGHECDDDGVDIVRILHKRMDVDRSL